jgi:hypothetical protein
MRGLALARALTFAALGAGCVGNSLVDARVSAARESEGALDTLHDYEVGQVGAMSRIAELEGLYAASQADSRVSLLLARAWCKLSFEFTLDDYEQALESGDGPSASYHLLRARSGYQRAQFYADAWLERRAPGFGAALADDGTLPAWLARQLANADSAEALLWAGMARLGYADTAKDTPDAPSARKAGTRLVTHSLLLAPKAASGLGHVALALAAARAQAPDLGLVERELGQAEAAARGRLLVPLFRARTLACLRHDRRSFELELERVLGESDPDPNLRLENAAAKRRARRYLTSSVVGAECFDAKG